jgi:xanthine dehydrogenase YagT iron-sulfur-binding subunit
MANQGNSSIEIIEPGNIQGLSRRSFIAVSSGLAGSVAASHAATDTLTLMASPLELPAAASSKSEPSKIAVNLTVNGEARQFDLDPRQSLLDLLRENLNLTGTKKGCNQGACGACTVLINGKRILSCLTLAAMCDGAQIQTIEGLASGDILHPLQACFIKHDGLQCGFCTPGQIMSGVGCITEGHARSPEEISFWMSGNVCRCGAYLGIVAAISEAAGRA